MSLTPAPVFSISAKNDAQLTLTSRDGHVAHVFVLEQDVIRVMVLPKGELHHPRSWSVAPGAEDVATQGRDRFDLHGFSCPSYTMSEADGVLTIQTERLRLTIKRTGFYCAWESLIDGEWKLMAADRHTQAYNFGWWDKKVYHYLKSLPNEMFFGLGERTGDANRAGQSYRMKNIDSIGYNARTTDPLYKHVPFYMLWKTDFEAPLGFFYDTLADCTFDMGREIDGYHLPFRSFVADYGDLDFYVIAGDTPADITRRFTWLTGRPAFMPKWSLGYSGSTMIYTDAPNAQERMNEFLAKCAEHDIPCTSFHLSSGYTSIGKKRYVFNWDEGKFPDAKGFVQHYLDHGVKLCANIKPCLLVDHPRYEEAVADGLLVHNADGSPTKVEFWEEAGTYLDFTNPKTIDWWKDGVKTALLEYGVAATWNDNNEFEIWSDQGLVNGFGTERDARETRPLYTMLMMRASAEAQREFAPETRPFLVSRSGGAGMQRYVQTWSGDNRTSWETLKYNIRMGTGLAVSGVSNTGHDIGGFAGLAPDQELFLRWVQFGIFLPRFSIHSWNDDGSVNEPWMYPEITHHISNLIKFRGKLTPYFYDLLWRSHSDFEPMIQPTYYQFPDDPKCFEENDEMLLGADLMVAAVVEPDQRERRVYLPKGANWYDFWSGEFFEGGKTVVVPAPWDKPPLLAREGSAIPLNLAEQHFNHEDDARGFAIFPLKGDGSFTAKTYEDDGWSEEFRKGQYGFWDLTVTSAAAGLEVAIARTGKVPPAAKAVTLVLPLQETRPLTVKGGTIAGETRTAESRVVSVTL